MSIIKKITVLLVISMIVILFCGTVNADYTTGYDIKGENSQSPYKNNYDEKKTMTITKDSFHNMTHFYCIDQNKHFKEGDQFQLYEKYFIFRSDSDNKFERAAAYIFNEANKVDNALDGYSGGKIGYSQYYKEANGENGFTNNVYGKQVSYQGALWKLEYWLSTTGGGLKGLFANCSVKNDTSYTNTIYETALKQSKTDTECSISTSDTILMENNIGTINVKSKKGTITGVKFIWDDGSKETVTSDKTGTNNIKIYSNKSCEAKYEMKVSNIKVGDFYFKNLKTNVKLAKVQISIKGEEGYYVVVHKWKPINRNDCQQLIEVGSISSHKITNTQTKTINVKYRKLTVRKIDYDDNTLLNKSEFVIFEKDTGWIGYKNNNITTGNSWSNAYRFKTGTGYCGEIAYTGEFTLNNLPAGYYYIFEVATGSNLYSLKGQPGYSANSNYSFLSNDKWKMNGIESVLIGRNSCANGFTKVGLADGTPYSFYPWKYVNKNKTTDTVCNYVRLSEYNSSFKYSDKYYYATNHATVTIKNRKNTKLTILKKDKDTNAPIANVGIKVLVKTTETRFTLNSYKWIKKDGTVTANANEAYEFKTNNNGKVEILNVPYGKYYIFETSTADDNYKLELQDHFMEGKPEDYKGTFLSEQYVYLGSKTITPNTNNDLNNNKYTSNVIENDWYRIRSNLNKDYFIRPAYYGRENNIKMITNKYETNYDWFNYRISYVNQGNYVIARRYTMGSDSDDSIELYRPISIDKAKISNNQIVEQYEYTGSDAQLWKFSKISNTTNQYNIVSKMNTGYGLHINALTPSNGTNIDIYNIQEANGKASKGSTLKFNLVTDAKFGVYDVKGTRQITVEAINIKNENKGKLTVIKIDGSYTKDLNTNKKLRLKGSEIKIYAANLEKEDTNKGWVQEIKHDNGNIEYTYGSYKDATTFKIGNTGNIELNGVFYGNYYIYETKTPTGYPITEQPGYHKKNEGSSDLGDNDWVFLGNTKLDDQNNDVIYNADNFRYISLKGKVWEDNPDRKDNAYNNIYDGQDWTIQNDNITKDSLLSGINVNLYSNKDGKNELIATTTTGENGEYEFKNKTNGEKLTYWEIAYCYVEFIYDNKEYVLSTPFVGDNLDVNSKAQEKEVIATGGEHNLGELYDGNLSGKIEDFPGKAVTYQGNVSGLNLQTIKNNETANQSQRLLTGFYNDETYTIENINLGLVKKIEPTFAIEQEIEYVKIKRGDYTFTYNMRT